MTSVEQMKKYDGRPWRETALRGSLGCVRFRPEIISGAIDEDGRFDRQNINIEKLDYRWMDSPSLSGSSLSPSLNYTFF